MTSPRPVDLQCSAGPVSAPPIGTPPNSDVGLERSKISAYLAKIPFFYWGVIFLCFGQLVYFLAIFLSILRLLTLHVQRFVPAIQSMLWASGMPSTIGLLLIAADLAFMLPLKRRIGRHVVSPLTAEASCTVALTAYNDEASIYDAVRDFAQHPRVRRVIVVSNNSTDRTEARAYDAGAIVLNEPRQGYGACVCRCLQEAAEYTDTDLIVLCEGDMTFRAADIAKFLAYIPHAEIVGGTRIVEQLRSYQTQLSTFMYYGNFFVGKLLELKHLGKGTFTDVGTTYKMIRRDALQQLFPKLDASVNLEFNAHFLDTALASGLTLVECPITFFSRVGQSKGGNVNNLRALKVGLRMIFGLSFGWGRYKG